MALVKASAKHTNMLIQLKPGMYLCKVASSEEKVNKTQTGNNVLLEYEVIDGDSIGASITSYYSLTHDMGIAKLTEVYRALTGDTSPEPQYDTDKFVGQQIVIEVEYQKYEGKDSPNVVRVFPKDTATDVPF